MVHFCTDNNPFLSPDFFCVLGPVFGMTASGAGFQAAGLACKIGGKILGQAGAGSWLSRARGCTCYVCYCLWE